MFFYLYDAFVSEPKNESTRSQVEARLIELGINGRVERLSPLKNIKELLRSGVKQEAHTIVVVGDDSTFLRAMNIVAGYDVALGYIPFDSKTGVAKVLGIPDTFAACDILSRRIISTAPLLKVNQNYVFNAVTVESLPSDLQIDCDKNFTVSSSQGHTLRIANLDDIGDEQADHSLVTVELLEPSTGRKRNVEPVVSSLVSATQLKITSRTGTPVLLDGITQLKTPLTVTRQPNKVKVIVGKHRLIA